ncbi:MAG: DUF4258 domain-containing protein [Alphaproteobacteria bacterium]|nr:DUF4258 domain-containing protein [Alphaproteobacteria bacterium]
MRIILSRHARQRLFERGVSVETVTRIIKEDRTIVRYDDDKPYPSRLVLGYDGKRPVHILIAENTETDELIVITVYEPSPDMWLPGWTHRKRP